MPLDEIPFHQPHKVGLEVLRFDPENPRFTPDSDLDGSSDVDVIKFFYRTADLGELLQSIASSGTSTLNL